MGRLDAAQFRDRRKIFVDTQVVKLRAATGFLEITGTAHYMTRAKKVTVQIRTTKLSPSNCGPPKMATENVEWPMNSSDLRAIKAHLTAVLKRFTEDIQLKGFPAIDDQSLSCNVTGESWPKFRERVCAGCTCWYCTVDRG